MPDIGPLSPTATVAVPYPEVPANLVGKLNDLIAASDRTSTHLSQSSDRVQTFMSKANGAVQNVASISQGKATQALVDTWFYSTKDGHHAHTSMTEVAGHLRTATVALEPHILAVKEGMSAVQALQANGGLVPRSQADEVQQQIGNLTNALSNISLVLHGAAEAINALNNIMPSSCATGFLPGGFYPTFREDSFHTNQVNMANDEPLAGGGMPYNRANDPRYWEALRLLPHDKDLAEAIFDMIEENHLSDTAQFTNNTLYSALDALQDPNPEEARLALQDLSSYVNFQEEADLRAFSEVAKGAPLTEEEGAQIRQELDDAHFAKEMAKLDEAQNAVDAYGAAVMERLPPEERARLELIFLSVEGRMPKDSRELAQFTAQQDIAALKQVRQILDGNDPPFGP